MKIVIENRAPRTYGKKSCDACWHWYHEGPDDDPGICAGAVERARKVVPFAVDLMVSCVFARAGSTCPCFESRTQIMRMLRETLAKHTGTFPADWDSCGAHLTEEGVAHCFQHSSGTKACACDAEGVVTIEIYD